MIIATILLLAAGITAPVIGLRTRDGGHLAWTAFKKRTRRIDASLLAIFVTTLGVEICLQGIAIVRSARIAALLLQFPLLLLMRRYGYLIAFFRDRDNWSRPKR